MNILIVDDELLIHKSIEKLISTHFPAAVVYHAYNGNQMLEELAARPVALAYVDIKMPGLSGLEAIRRAREEISPFTRYYIMTGFNEFEYAKQAVKLKVDDYLMKPLDSNTIRETVQSAAAVLQQRLEQKKNVFRNWLESAIHQRIGDFYEYCGFYCCLALFNMDSQVPPVEVLSAVIAGYEEQMVSVLIPEGLLLLVFSEKPEPVYHVQKQFSRDSYPDKITCFLGNVTNDAEELLSMLPPLLSYSCLRVFLGRGRIYHLTPLLNTNPQQLEYCRLCVKWQDSYIRKDYQAYNNFSELLCTQFQYDDWPQKYREHLLSFVDGVLEHRESSRLEYDQLRNTLMQAGRELLNSPVQDSKVQVIIKFIQEHYRENISTAELSRQFGLSANYISNLIKNALGIRYSEYITKLRLTYAKELLASTGLSVKEITCACGYYSQSHFTKLFLEHEHCTPLEFRKSVPFHSAENQAHLLTAKERMEKTE